MADTNMAVSVEGACAEVRAWSVRVPKGDGPRLMEQILSAASREGCEVLVLEGSMVFGKDHLKSALYHAIRSIERGTNSSQSVAMETLLYASGERQLSAAIRKMTASEKTEELVVAVLSRCGFEPGPDWEPLPDRPPKIDLKRLHEFGISEEETNTVGPTRAAELVLERVAAVDILRR